MPAQPGSHLGPYEIIALLGKGGMGEVYKAIDTRLGRTVAIKLIQSVHADRFKREARAIAALNHPHICTLYDVGPDYLVMEYVEGTPLCGPLPTNEVLELAVQVAGALEAAHEKGVVHRDLKPGNILVSRSGVKLLDFGLAKVLESAAAGDSTVTQTQPGTILGTAAYMSPEQATGKPVDARSDIFSFGLVLYEVLSGRRAFSGDNSIAMIAAILHKEPEPPDGPREISQIVTRCLRKAPAERFQTAAELKAVLLAVGRMNVSAQPPSSVAVLPFVNLSADKEDEYFSDGLAEEIINTLARARGLKVIARTSAFAFKGKEQDIRRIAEALNVRTILEGSVRRAGNRIRVMAQLINAEDQSHLWSERYDRELTDVFAVQDEIAFGIAGALQVTLAGKPADRREQNPAFPAYEAYLKGLHHLFKNTPESLVRSKEHLGRAVALDPEYAAPHVLLAACHFLLGVNGLQPAREVAPLIVAENRRALELDPSESLAHASLGSIAGAYDHDWKELEQRFQVAMAIAPVSGMVRWAYANFGLAPFGRFQEAAEQMEKWIEQDPLNVAARAELSFFLNHGEQYDRALTAAQEALEVDEDYWFAHYTMSEACMARGLLAEALAAAENAYRLAPWSARVIGMLAGILRQSGNKHRTEALIQQLRHAAPVGMLVYYLLSSETERAAEWYAKAIEQREFYTVIYARAPITRPLRQSRYWPALARTMNLPETA